MKKKTAAALAALMALMLAACADSGDDLPVSASAVYTQIEEQTETEKASEETATQLSETDLTQTQTQTEEQTEAAAAVSCADITAKIMESVEMSSMAEIGRERLPMYLNLSVPTDCDFSMYICGSGGFADEILVIKTDLLDTDTLDTAVEERNLSRQKDFEGYNPDEYDKLQNYFSKYSNGYYIYAVTGDNDTCESVFDDFVK